MTDLQNIFTQIASKSFGEKYSLICSHLDQFELNTNQFDFNIQISPPSIL